MGDAVRPGRRSWWALAFSFWALAGTAGSAYLFVVSTGPVQATSDYGIWFSLAPPESLPAWTGLGPYGPSLYPFARLVLFSWWLALIVFPVASRLSKIQRPDRWLLAWAGAGAAGTILAIIAIASYRFPPTVDDSSDMGYHYVPVTVINWQEIPIAIGFLVLAAVMWLLLTAHPSRQG